ncbi:MAG: metal ABC transporter ATP-binding protein [Planctomycetia bacterium]|nr:metal ABC transporter ATP-binding protein [Planctomycetia bacterium]
MMLEARHLTFAYTSEITVLQDLSFSVNAGEFVGIIGANGSGKSTLLRLLLHQLEPTSGKLFLWDTDVRNVHDWTRVGYVPQNHQYLGSAFPATVEELILANMYSQIGMFRFPNASHRKKVREVLEQVGMEGMERRRIGTLSGGQMQRVLIARVLANAPELLILDEPTNGMDSESASSLYDLLQNLNQTQAITVLMVTHDLHRASAFLGRIFCLEEGSLVELQRDQLLHELHHRHRHPDGTRECHCDP